MGINNPYTKEFYDATSKERVDSAKEIAPFIVNSYGAHSMVDVGCARGEWLHEAKLVYPKLQCVGIDGPYIDPGDRMEGIKYLEANIEKGLPEIKNGPFDIGLCLEVGEHLTVPAGVELVNWLCGNCNMVVWSAAIPQQGGVCHQTERWQSYWSELFLKRGFHPSLEIRENIWGNHSVQPYYAQNIVTYSPWSSGGAIVLDVVHPRMWEYKINALRGAS